MKESYRRLAAKDSARISCQPHAHRGVYHPATHCRTWQTAHMAAPAFEYLCDEVRTFQLALDRRGEHRQGRLPA